MSIHAQVATMKEARQQARSGTLVMKVGVAGRTLSTLEVEDTFLHLGMKDSQVILMKS